MAISPGDFLFRVHRYFKYYVTRTVSKAGWRSETKVYGTFGFVLVAISLLTYLVSWLIFRDFHHIAIFFFHDLGFLPLHILFVTVVLERLLRWREKRLERSKTYMGIGVFFSELGSELLDHLSECDEDHKKTSDCLQVTEKWSHHRFAVTRRRIRRMRHSFRLDERKLLWLRQFLISRRQFLLMLMGNSNLMERESFTETLWGVLRLEVELSARENVRALPLKDVRQLSQELGKLYLLLITQWLSYLEHLKSSSPHLFQLGLGMSPFHREVEEGSEPDDMLSEPSATSYVTISASGDGDIGNLSDFSDDIRSDSDTYDVHSYHPSGSSRRGGSTQGPDSTHHSHHPAGSEYSASESESVSDVPPRVSDVDSWP